MKLHGQTRGISMNGGIRRSVPHFASPGLRGGIRHAFIPGSSRGLLRRRIKNAGSLLLELLNFKKKGGMSRRNTPPTHGTEPHRTKRNLTQLDRTVQKVASKSRAQGNGYESPCQEKPAEPRGLCRKNGTRRNGARRYPAEAYFTTLNDRSRNTVEANASGQTPVPPERPGRGFSRAGMPFRATPAETETRSNGTAGSRRSYNRDRGRSARSGRVPGAP
ncbi:MAG: hypothetical protein G01um101438_1000 [Parcubacteria group bacterium Gr01-1014_38]|nr:MAG: hypothetical protein G01um101438_1000 [Parcubacteria group bacterium Gr01-1014_38]